MGFDKLLAPLCGRPVVWHSVKAFADCPLVQNIVVVVRGDLLSQFAKELEGIAGEVRLVEGGEMRHHSVWNGLQAVSAQGDELIAVHDAARPLISGTDILECAKAAAAHGGAACAHAVTETLKKASSEGMITDSLDRGGVWAMETPQIFQSARLISAYEAVMKSGEAVTDETSAFMAAGHPVRLVKSTSPNIKITYAGDMKLAEILMRERMAEGLGQ